MRAGITNYVHAKYFASHPHSAMYKVMHFDKYPARFSARLVEICNRLQEPIALAVQICDEMGIDFASQGDMIADALASQAKLRRKVDRLAAKIGGTPIADFIAFVETMDISDCPRYAKIETAVHNDPASPATGQPYQLVLSDTIDYEALCLAKCAELGYQVAPEPIDAPSGLIDLTGTRNKQERRNAAKQYGFARGDSAAEWLTNAREHNRMLTFVDARTAPKASRSLRIAADSVVKSTVTKARKPYRHCGSGLQNNPVKRPTPKPIALMAMLGSMVDLAVLFVGAVGILGAARSEAVFSADRQYTLKDVWVALRAIGKSSVSPNSFMQSLRMQPIAGNGMHSDSAFAQRLDAHGMPRNIRCQWQKAGLPGWQAEIIFDDVKAR